MQHLETAKNGAAQPAHLIDGLLEDLRSKTRKLRNNIRLALIKGAMKVEDAVALAELHHGENGSACSKKLLETLGAVAKWLEVSLIADRPERRTLLINRALRSCDARLPDCRQVKTWRREDTEAQRPASPPRVRKFTPRAIYAMQ